MRDPYEQMDSTAEISGVELAPELSRYTAYLLRRVVAHFSSDVIQRSTQSREFVVLAVLADNDVYSQQELAERLDINRTIMVKLIDRLEGAGYVTRTHNLANRRAYVLSLTDLGRSALKDMRRTVAQYDRQLTAALDPWERKRLNALLGALHPEREWAIDSTEYLITQVFYALRRRGDAILADVELRLRHFAPLSAVETLGPCPQQQLARYLAITEPAAAEVVNELAQLGLVGRGQDPSDRRRYALELTDLGRERLAVVRTAIDRLQAELVATLGADGDEELRTLLGKLLSAPSSSKAHAGEADPMAAHYG